MITILIRKKREVGGGGGGGGGGGRGRKEKEKNERMGWKQKKIEKNLFLL